MHTGVCLILSVGTACLKEENVSIGCLQAHGMHLAVHLYSYWLPTGYKPFNGGTWCAGIKLAACLQLCWVLSERKPPDGTSSPWGTSPHNHLSRCKEKKNVQKSSTIYGIKGFISIQQKHIYDEPRAKIILSDQE